MNDQNDLLSNENDKKYKRPKSQDNKHFLALVRAGFSTKQLSDEFCHDLSTIQKWLSGEQQSPAWTVVVANALISTGKNPVSKYIISPTTKEDESYILSTLARLGISYKKFDF